MTTHVPVAPAVLEWAADQSNLDDAEIGEKFPRWHEWLAGERQPTVRDVEKVAKKIGVPFGYLLLREPPRLELPIPDFRDGFEGPIDQPTWNLRSVLNQSIQRQEWYRAYAQENFLPVVEAVGAAAEMEPTEAAASMRRILRFHVADRPRSWNEIRRYLVGSFEDLGGLTVVTSMVGNNTNRLLDPNEFRGFALVDNQAPLVFVNANQTLNGQIFSLAHELAHIWHGSSGISLEDPASNPRSDIEKWCNDVASEFLVPGEDLARSYEGLDELPLATQLDRLAQVYKCGTLVVLQALRRHGLRNFEDFDADYRVEVDRLNSIDRSRRGGGGDYYRNQRYRIGARLSRAIIKDTLEGRTPISEAISIMSIGSLSNFDKYASYMDVT
jgi:Zn-dependent peptidase ImmA (M78 family)